MKTGQQAACCCATDEVAWQGSPKTQQSLPGGPLVAPTTHHQRCQAGTLLPITGACLDILLPCMWAPLLAPLIMVPLYQPMVPHVHLCRIILEQRQCLEALFLGLLMPARDELQGWKVCSDSQVF